jgi:hypothetical protein
LLWENEWKKIRQKEGLVLRATSEGADEQNPDRGHLMLVQVKNPEAMTISIQSAL